MSPINSWPTFELHRGFSTLITHVLRLFSGGLLSAYNLLEDLEWNASSSRSFSTLRWKTRQGFFHRGDPDVEHTPSRIYLLQCGCYLLRNCDARRGGRREPIADVHHSEVKGHDEDPVDLFSNLLFIYFLFPHILPGYSDLIGAVFIPRYYRAERCRLSAPVKKP